MNSSERLVNVRLCLCVLAAVEEGPVFAMCMAGQGDQATLNQWICGLQQDNPILGQVPTLFRLEDGARELQAAAEPQSGQHRTGQEERPEEEPEAPEEEEESRRARG